MIILLSISRHSCTQSFPRAPAAAREAHRGGGRRVTGGSALERDARGSVELRAAVEMRSRHAVHEARGCRCAREGEVGQRERGFPGCRDCLRAQLQIAVWNVSCGT